MYDGRRDMCVISTEKFIIKFYIYIYNLYLYVLLIYKLRQLSQLQFVNALSYR